MGNQPTSRSQITLAAAVLLVLLSGIVIVLADSVPESDQELGTSSGVTSTTSSSSTTSRPDVLPSSTTTFDSTTSTVSPGTTPTSQAITTTTRPRITTTTRPAATTTTTAAAATTTTTAAASTTTTTAPIGRGPKPAHAIYAVSRNDGGITGLIAMDGNGGNPKTLFASSDVRSPDLSPDGTFLLFREGQGKISRVGVDGTGYKVVVTAFLFQAPRISPDGKSFLVSEIPSNGTVPRLVSYDINGGARSELAIPASRNPTQVDWSPDGKKALYTDGSLAELYIYTLADGTSASIGDGSGRAMVDPRWSPADGVIAFHNDNRIYTVATSGGAWKAVTPTSIKAVQNLTWEPGGSILYEDQSDDIGLRRIKPDGSGSFPVTDRCCLDPAA